MFHGEAIGGSPEMELTFEEASELEGVQVGMFELVDGMEGFRSIPGWNVAKVRRGEISATQDGGYDITLSLVDGCEEGSDYSVKVVLPMSRFHPQHGRVVGLDRVSRNFAAQVANGDLPKPPVGILEEIHTAFITLIADKKDADNSDAHPLS